MILAKLDLLSRLLDNGVNFDYEALGVYQDELFKNKDGDIILKNSWLNEDDTVGIKERKINLSRVADIEFFSQHINLSIHSFNRKKRRKCIIEYELWTLYKQSQTGYLRAIDANNYFTGEDAKAKLRELLDSGKEIIIDKEDKITGERKVTNCISYKNGELFVASGTCDNDYANYFIEEIDDLLLFDDLLCIIMDEKSMLFKVV